MRLGLISDTHNAIHKMKIALEHFRREEITTVLHAGDVTSPETLRAFRRFDLWLAWGNQDTDELLPLVEELWGSGRMAALHRLTFEGSTLALLHGDNRPELENLIAAGTCHYIIHGHTHAPRDERIGPTRVINPGCIGAVRWRDPGYAILDLTTDTLETFEL